MYIVVGIAALIKSVLEVLMQGTGLSFYFCPLHLSNLPKGSYLISQIGLYWIQKKVTVYIKSLSPDCVRSIELCICVLNVVIIQYVDNSLESYNILSILRNFHSLNARWKDLLRDTFLIKNAG